VAALVSLAAFGAVAEHTGRHTGRIEISARVIRSAHVSIDVGKTVVVRSTGSVAVQTSARGLVTGWRELVLPIEPGPDGTMIVTVLLDAEPR
jgi:hypothetical protein